MEALTAVSLAALTLYDMLKAIDRGMVIGEIALWEKRGGRSGTWKRGTAVRAAEADAPRVARSVRKPRAKAAPVRATRTARPPLARPAGKAGGAARRRATKRRTPAARIVP
jgi:hypothetical protein